MKAPSILIVDDDESDRYLLRRMLMKQGLVDVIYESGDGKEALALFSDDSMRNGIYPDWSLPDLVFLDINMPLLGGFGFLEAFNALRESGNFRSVSFVMLSSSGRAEDQERALAYDFVRGFVVKSPSTAKDICERIKDGCNFD